MRVVEPFHACAGNGRPGLALQHVSGPRKRGRIPNTAEHGRISAHAAYPAAVELLRTERMILRPWAEQDVAAFFDIYSRDEVARWLGAHPRRPVSDIEDARRRLLGWRTFHDGFEAPYGLWAMVPFGLNAPEGSSATSGGPAAPIGTALLLPLTDDDGPTDQFEVGWHLHPDFQGRGLATEAAAALLAVLPANGPERVLALTDLDNTKSQAVAARLGMVNQGPTDRWFGETLFQFCWTRPPATGQ